MKHEEKAREIALWLYGPDEGMSEGLVRTLIDKITEALASAEKKGREESEKEIKTLNGVINDMLASDEEIYCRGWNEAITAAVKVAEELSKGYDNEWNNKLGIAKHYIECGEEIASKIEALRKG